MTKNQYLVAIKAEYDTRSSGVTRLRRDLESLDRITAFETLRAQIAATEKSLAGAGKRLADMKSQSGTGQEISRQFVLARKDVDQLGQTLAAQKGSLEQMAAGFRAAGLELNKLGAARMELERSTVAQTRDNVARNILGVRSIRDIESEIGRLKKAYATLKASSSGLFDQDRIVAADRMRQKIAALKEETNGWTNHIARLQQGWAGLIGVVAAVGGAGAAVSSFVALDDALRQIQVSSSASAADMERLEGMAKKLGATTRHSAQDVAGGMLYLAKSGQSAEQVIASLPHVLDLATAGNVDLGRAADYVVNILSQFGLKAGEAERVVDVLVKGDNLATTSVDELAQALSFAGPVAKSFGWSLEQTVAAIAMLSDAGAKGERAGTALRGGLAALASPAGAAKDIIFRYGIAINDATGKMRPFADILDDIGAEGLTAAEKLDLFGLNAGPGMIAMLDKGGDSLREYEQGLQNITGTARKQAEAMDAGIGGALRLASSSMKDLVLQMGEGLAAPVTLAANAVKSLAGGISEITPAIKTLIAGLTGLAFATAAWHLGLKHIWSAVQLAGPHLLAMGKGLLPLLTREINFAALAAGGLTKAFAVFGGVLGAAFIGWQIGEALNKFDAVQRAGIAMAAGLTKSWLYMKLVWASLTGGNTEAVRKEMAEADAIYARMFTELGQKVKNMAAVQDAEQKKITARTKGHVIDRSEAEKKALDDLIEKYEKLRDKVLSIQQEITDRQRSLSAELRDMDRQNMSDAAAWRDRRREASEFYEAAGRAAAEAKRLADAGNMEGAESAGKEAVKMADQAREAFKALGREVKDGEDVIISQAVATKIAAEGVQQAGQLAIKILEQQKQATQEMADRANNDIGRVLGVVTDATTKIEAMRQQVVKVRDTWLEVWTRSGDDAGKVIDGLGRNLDTMTKDRTMKLDIELTSKAKAMIDAFKNVGLDLRFPGFRTGGHIPGWGGGDRVPAMLEPGEWVIRKEAVSRYGGGLFAALNSMKIDAAGVLRQRIASDLDRAGWVGEIGDSPRVRGQSPSTTREIIDINLKLPGGQAPVRVSADRMNAAELLRQLALIQRFASS